MATWQSLILAFLSLHMCVYFERNIVHLNHGRISLDPGRALITVVQPQASFSKIRASV